MPKQHTRIVLLSLSIVIGILLALRLYSYWTTRYTFAGVQEGQRMTGETTVSVEAQGTSPFVCLWIDGRKYGDRLTHTDYKIRYADFSLDTAMYANGPHVLEVKIGDKLWDRCHVVFQNAKSGK